MTGGGIDDVLKVLGVSGVPSSAPINPVTTDASLPAKTTLQKSSDRKVNAVPTFVKPSATPPKRIRRRAERGTGTYKHPELATHSLILDDIIRVAAYLL